MRLLLIVLSLLVAWQPGTVAQQSTVAQDFSPATHHDRDDTWKKCRGNDPDARLLACSQLIDARQDTPTVPLLISHG